MAVATKSKPNTKKRTTKKSKLKLAVAYIRMSSDQQEDSPERQRAEVNKIAEKGGYQILKWYEDHGKTGTKSKNRPQFQQLLKDAKGGGFVAVLMHEQSRFGRETMLQFASHLNHLHELGVDLVTRKGKISPDDIGGFITAMVDQYGARAESENISHRTTSGRRQKIQSTGTWVGQSPFGYDRMILDLSGNLITTIKYDGQYVRSSSQICRLTPSTDTKAIEFIRIAFQQTLDGESLRSIAIRFNEAGLRTRNGNQFSRVAIRRMLKNPAYYGALVSGRDSVGVFSKMFEEVTVINEKAHEGIVNKKTFKAVESILDSRPRRANNTRRFLLSGLVVCGHCGVKAYAHSSRNGSRKHSTFYQCDGYHATAKRGAKSCVSITGLTLERAVLNVIKTKILTPENLRRCEAEFRASQGQKPKINNRVADELRAKIERATENLALAEDAADFSMISTQIRAWRAELSKVTASKPLPSSPFRGIAMANLEAAREALELSDRGKLSDAIHQAVESVIITNAEPETRNFKREAKVLFTPEVYPGGSITIPSEDLRIQRNWTDIPKFVGTLGRRAKLEDIMKEFGVTHSTAYCYTKWCVQAGSLSKNRVGVGDFEWFLPESTPVT